MVRWALIGSYGLFNIILIALLWGDSWLPRAAGFTVIAFILAAWLLSAYLLFNHSQLAWREKAVSWLFVFAFIGYSVARRFSSYYLLANGSWLMWFGWGVAGLLFIFTAAGLASLIVGKDEPSASTSYTVESEAPDHVLHVGGTPNHSLKRTAADRLQ